MHKHSDNLLLWAPLFLYTALVGVQLFGPVPIGLANNNDFPRVLGSLRLWPVPPFRDDSRVLFRYFVNDYVVSPPKWSPGVPTSEWLIAKLAKYIARKILPHGTFRLQIMGAVHASIFLLALWMILRAFRHHRWWLRAITAALFVLVWADLEYVQQFSTAYTDAGAIAAFAVIVAITVSCALATRPVRWPWTLAFAVSSCFLLATKLQHDTALPFLIFFCVWVGIRQPTCRGRAAWLAVPVLMAATVIYMVTNTPEDYRTAPSFTVVFNKLTVLADPKVVLAHFNMPEQEFAKYRGHYAYEAEMPHDQPEFWVRVRRLVTPASLAELYLFHPGILARVLWFDLRGEASNVTLDDYGHLRPIDQRQGKHAFELRLWSGFRKGLFAITPLHLVLFFAFVLAMAVACMLHPNLRARFPLWPVALLATLMAISSFLFASLCDAVETGRHLVFFQVTTDTAMICVLLSILLEIERRRSVRQG